MRQAPELQVSEWINTDQPMQLSDLRGKVAVIHAFQILCPACVDYAIPQTSMLHERFKHDPEVIVFGLHTVFENHQAMGPDALKSYIQTHKLSFPIGIDQPSADPKGIPRTMEAYDMQGTPTLILIDRRGFIRLQKTGIVNDSKLVEAIASLR